MIPGSFGSQFYRFQQRALEWSDLFPGLRDFIDPSQLPEARPLEAFCSKYYADAGPRRLVVGINPGRRGSGLTGVPFTDGQSLANSCGIANPFEDQREMTSQFMYEIIESDGGPTSFFARNCLSAVFPHCLIGDGKNANYYELLNAADAARLARHSLTSHRESLDLVDELVIVGSGINAKLVRDANEELGAFARVEVLPHPRFILQYARAKLADYQLMYRRLLS